MPTPSGVEPIRPQTTSSRIRKNESFSAITKYGQFTTGGQSSAALPLEILARNGELSHHGIQGSPRHSETGCGLADLPHQFPAALGLPHQLAGSMLSLRRSGISHASHPNEESDLLPPFPPRGGVTVSFHQARRTVPDLPPCHRARSGRGTSTKPTTGASSICRPHGFGAWHKKPCRALEAHPGALPASPNGFPLVDAHTVQPEIPAGDADHARHADARRLACMNRRCALVPVHTQKAAVEMKTAFHLGNTQHSLWTES